MAGCMPTLVLITHRFTFLAPRPHGLAGGAPLARPSPSPGVIIVMNHQELPDIVDVLEHVFAP